MWLKIELTWKCKHNHSLCCLQQSHVTKCEIKKKQQRELHDFIPAFIIIRHEWNACFLSVLVNNHMLLSLRKLLFLLFVCNTWCVCVWIYYTDTEINVVKIMSYYITHAVFILKLGQKNATITYTHTQVYKYHGSCRSLSKAHITLSEWQWLAGTKSGNATKSSTTCRSNINLAGLWMKS